ncbi:MAG TPA: OmpW family outer membrane protein [Longimicrobiales bacterium]|nr:OmpW family outer membrane protein [Longimicrobiales bacterium]
MHARTPCFAVRCVSLLALATLPSPARAQAPGPDAPGPWGLRVRAVLSGSTHHSDPPGYTIYSGLGLELALVRRLGDAFAVELAARTESREVTGPEGSGDHRLGSMEMIPLNLSLAWRPRGRSDADLQPYLGAGVNVTHVWEKSGALDSTNPPPSLAPLIQMGTDWAVARRTAINLDVRWNPQTVEIRDFVVPTPTLPLDPLALGLGLTVRF